MSTITVEFAFEIGQIVYFRSANNNAVTVPKKFIIYERVAQECHGGVQKLYRLFGDSHQPRDEVPETVLSSERPELEPASDEHLMEFAKHEMARRNYPGDWKESFDALKRTFARFKEKEGGD